MARLAARRQVPAAGYRVRARNAHAPQRAQLALLTTYANKVIEPRTKAAIIRFFGGVVYRPMRQSLLLKFT